MRIEILGSSSSGNCYLLRNNDEVLIIEAGVNIEKVKKALDFDFSRVVGLILTHEHGDHASEVQKFLEYNIELHASAGTLGGLHSKGVLFGGCVDVIVKPRLSLGNFKITPFNTFHDTAEPFGFIIEHHDFGKLLFCTDSKKLPYKFNSLDHILIEANYDFNLIPKSAIRDRTYQNHMEIGTTIQFLKNNDLSNVKNIVLLHLSDSNSNEMAFKQRVEALTTSNVFIAKEGLKINLNKEVF